MARRRGRQPSQHQEPPPPTVPYVLRTLDSNDRDAVETHLSTLRNYVAAKQSLGRIGDAEINWLQNAVERTEDYYKNGPQGPVSWILTSGMTIPAGAFLADGKGIQPQRVARGFLHNGIQVGISGSNRAQAGAILGYGWREFIIDLHEILVASPEDVQWVPMSGRLSLAALGARPVEGGHESDGEPLYVVQAYWEHMLLPGKHGEGLPSAHIPYGGREHLIDNYRVLCYRD